MKQALPASDILARLKTLAVDRVPIDLDAFNLNSSLHEIGIDSFSLIELVFIAEEEFAIRIPVDDIQARTLGDVVGVIQRAMAKD